MEKIISFLFLCYCTIGSFSQTVPKFQYDCEEELIETEDFYVNCPSKEDGFMAAVNLSNPSNWMNQDTLKFTTFTTDNLCNKMSMVYYRAKSKFLAAEITFSSLKIY